MLFVTLVKKQYIAEVFAFNLTGKWGQAGARGLPAEALATVSHDHFADGQKAVIRLIVQIGEFRKNNGVSLFVIPEFLKGLG